jgi:hypothetical protein
MTTLDNPVTIHIGGRDRELRYTMGSYRRLQKLLGKSFITGELKAIDESMLPEALLEGLQDREGIADADALAEMIAPAMVPAILSAFVKAFYEQDMPEPSSDPNGSASQAPR